MSISDKLQELVNIKKDIKKAIQDKNVSMTNVEFGEYAGKIDEMTIGTPLEQFVSFPTDYTIGSGTGSLNHNEYRLLTFMSRNPYGWGADVSIKIYYKNESNEEVLLTSKWTGMDEFNFIVIPRSYGTLKITMTLDPTMGFTMWSGFTGFYAKTKQPNVVEQLSEPSYDGVLLSYVDFDVLHVVYTAVGD